MMIIGFNILCVATYLFIVDIVIAVSSDCVGKKKEEEEKLFHLRARRYFCIVPFRYKSSSFLIGMVGSGKNAKCIIIAARDLYDRAERLGELNHSDD